MVEALYDKVIVKTMLRKLPKCCIQCHFYDNMGGKRGYHNNGACIIQNFKSTEGIQVSKMRLDTCPLRLVKRKKYHCALYLHWSDRSSLARKPL